MYYIYINMILFTFLDMSFMPLETYEELKKKEVKVANILFEGLYIGWEMPELNKQIKHISSSLAI